MVLSLIITAKAAGTGAKTHPTTPTVVERSLSLFALILYDYFLPFPYSINFHFLKGFLP
jgi:hypothetical protein